MNTKINEATSRKRKTDINMPISLNTHLIRKSTKQHTATISMSDHAAGLTFVSNHIHTTTYANLITNFMLIPEVWLFFCFVLAAKGQRWDTDKNFWKKKYAHPKNEEKRKILGKTSQCPNFSFHSSGIPLLIEHKLSIRMPMIMRNGKE